MSSISKQVKPRYNPLLWAQILPSARGESLKPPGVENPSKEQLRNIPIIPENEKNASLRMILHDTKNTLEQFSDRLANLVDGVEQSKRDIDTLNRMFAEGNDKLLDEVNAIATRSQKVLLEKSGSPAQAEALEDLRTCHMNSYRKLELLENRIELIQNQLQAISEQQGQILVSLASVTPLAPLLKDSPNQLNQILSSVGTLPDLLQVLQTLPTHLKAIQQEAFDKLTASISSMHSVSSLLMLSPLSMKAAQGTCHSSDLHVGVDQAQPLKRKHSMDHSSKKDQQPFSARLSNTALQREAIVLSNSDRTLSSDTSPHGLSLVMKAAGRTTPPYSSRSESNTAEFPLNPPSSHLSGGLSHSTKPSVDESRHPKRQKLETPLIRDPPLHDKTTATGNLLKPPLPSGRTLRSAPSLALPADGSKRALPQPKPRSEFSAFPCHPSSVSSGFRLPAAPSHASSSASSVPTPHAPGAFVQHQPTGPHRLLAATSHAPNHTPSPPARHVTRRVSTSGRAPISRLPPSSPPFLRVREAVDRVTSLRSGMLPKLSNSEVDSEARPTRNPSPLKDLQVYASSSSDLFGPKQTPRRTGQRMLLDDAVDVDEAED